MLGDNQRSSRPQNIIMFAPQKGAGKVQLVYTQDTKTFQNVMLVGMASEISKNYTYKCVDRSRHNGIKGAKAKCAH